jgi:hypothetical protein
MCIRVSPRGPNVGEVWASSMLRGEGRDAIAKIDLVRIYFKELTSPASRRHGMLTGACQCHRADLSLPVQGSLAIQQASATLACNRHYLPFGNGQPITVGQLAAYSELHAGEPGPARSGTTRPNRKVSRRSHITPNAGTRKKPQKKENIHEP